MLAVDADPQGNLTSGLGRKATEPRPSIYEVIIDQRPLDDILISTDLPHLTLAPADRNLTGAEVELVPAPGPRVPAEGGAGRRWPTASTTCSSTVRPASGSSP